MNASLSYPRPQFRRHRWQCLDGTWEFEIDPDGDCWSRPDQVPWSTSITVPFAPETPASGVGETGFFRACWYRRTFESEPLGPRERLLLHLGAVDYNATVWVNDNIVARHEGGYTPIDVDITDELAPYGTQTIVVHAADDPTDLTQPRGKQDWQREPHAIWYPRTTGIWQSVWLEPVSAAHIEHVRWTPNLERWEIGLEATIAWEEMPSVYRFTRQSVERLTSEWMRVLDRDGSHPCIVAWVPFNESWGVPDLPAIPAQRDCVRALYHLTKSLDPTRPVIGNDGWESLATDIVGIHDYDANLSSMGKRYTGIEVSPNLFRRERPGGRVLTIDGHPHAGQPVMLTEFGGIACTSVDEEEETWGYARSDNRETLARDYTALLDTIRGMEIFAGFCYTQFADTYQEANGLHYVDRTPKFPLEEIARATRGRKRNIWEE